MSRKRILLVVEGKKQEVSLFRVLFACYRLDLEYEIFPYGTNIYELYERMFADGAQDDLTLLGVLKERAPAEDRWLFDQNYSDMLLVFDYEPQDNRFSPERLAEMQRYFNESTDNGKLYVNYPMVEACKHFRKMPDGDFLNRAVALEDVSRYKAIVADESKYQNFERELKRPDVDAIIVLTALKALQICGESLEGNNAAFYNDVDHEAVLRAQNKRLKSEGKILVLGMCLLFILEYSANMVDVAQFTSEKGQALI